MGDAEIIWSGGSYQVPDDSVPKKIYELPAALRWVFFSIALLGILGTGERKFFFFFLILFSSLFGTRCFYLVEQISSPFDGC